MAENLLQSLGNMSSSAPSSAPSSQGSKDSNGMPGTADGAKAAVSTVPSEKMEKIQRMTRFLAESEVDLKQMAEATQELISLYELWEQYNERPVKEAFSRYIKGRGLDK